MIKYSGTDFFVLIFTKLLYARSVLVLLCSMKMSVCDWLLSTQLELLHIIRPIMHLTTSVITLNVLFVQLCHTLAVTRQTENNL